MNIGLYSNNDGFGLAYRQPVLTSEYPVGFLFTGDPPILDPPTKVVDTKRTDLAWVV